MTDPIGSVILEAVRRGVHVSFDADSWPARRTAKQVRISMTAQTWNGVRTINRAVSLCGAEGAADPAEEIAAVMRDMLHGMN